MIRTDRRRRALHALTCVAALVLAACATPARERFYTLSDPTFAPDPSGTHGAAAGGPVVQVGPVSVPDVVDRSQWVVREGTHDIAVLEQHRWAGQLSADIARALAGALQRRWPLGIALPYEPGQAVTRSPDAILSVAVTQFETIVAPGASIDDEFDWSLRCRAGSADPPMSGRRRVRVAARNGAGSLYEALAVAHATAIETLSEDLASQVEAFAKRCTGGIGAAR